MTTQANTSPETCSDKTIPDDTKDQPSESKSGSQDAIAFLSLIDGLTRLEREGARQALEAIERFIHEAEKVQREANFQRRREICGGMMRALNVAHRAILTEFQLEEGI